MALLFCCDDAPAVASLCMTDAYTKSFLHTCFKNRVPPEQATMLLIKDAHQRQLAGQPVPSEIGRKVLFDIGRVAAALLP